MVEPITEATTITISLRVVFTMISLAGAVVGVYVAGLLRDERLATRISEIERCQSESKDTLASLRDWQIESRGREKARNERKSSD